MKRSWLINIALRGATLVAVGALVGLGNHWLRLGVPSGDYQVATSCELPLDAPAEITPHQAAELCTDPHVLVLDVRSAELYAAGHVAGALHLACNARKLDSSLDEKLRNARMVVVYGQTTEEARPVTVSLMQRSFADVRIIAGGYPAWQEASLACSAGPCETCQAHKL